MRLINTKCDDNDSFKYSILLYLYYYNMKTNYFLNDIFLVRIRNT